VLQLLTLLATNRGGRYGIFAAAQFSRFAAWADDALGRTDTLLDQISDKLLKSLTVDEDDPVWQFLEDVATDQGAIIQLTPEGTNLFNAAVTDRSDVDYSCVVTATEPVDLSTLTRLRTPWGLTSAALFGLLQRLAGREHSAYPYPSEAHLVQEELDTRLPFELTAATNDGIVPTLSQVYGRPLGVVVGDHLDVVGQFRGAGGNRFSDWLPSGSGFDEERFVRVWGWVADAIAAA